jgi:hypothetical protein
MSRRRETRPEPAQLCEWWAMCANEATGTMPHPIIGDVPICDRCRAKVEQL